MPLSCEKSGLRDKPEPPGDLHASRRSVSGRQQELHLQLPGREGDRVAATMGSVPQAVSSDVTWMY